jgi:hypothetical protein
LSRRGDLARPISAMYAPRCGTCRWHVDCNFLEAWHDAEFILQATQPQLLLKETT